MIAGRDVSTVGCSATSHNAGNTASAAHRRTDGYCVGPPGLWLGMSVIGRFGAGLGEGVAGSGGMRPAGMSTMSLAAGPLTRLP